MTDDYFRQPGNTQPLMRQLLEREATLRAPCLGIARRDFLGGAMGALAAVSVLEQTNAFGSHAEWDQTSFDPAYTTLPLAEFEPLVKQFFDRVPAQKNRTADDCL
jgi:hypothetical protein